MQKDGEKTIDMKLEIRMLLWNIAFPKKQKFLQSTPTLIMKCNNLVV